jgi:O-antigen/teichoic acid export membrane protein
VTQTTRFDLAGRLRRIPDSVVLFVCLNVANTSNYLYQVIMGRELGKSGYGLFASVVALVNVVTVSLVALQTASAKAIASGTEARRPLRRLWDDPLTRATVQWGLIPTVVFVIAAPFIALFLHGGIGPALVVAAAMIPSGLLAISQGRLQGMHALHGFAALAMIVAVLRLVLGPAAVAAHAGVTGAGMAVVVAAALGALWGLHRSRDAGPVQPADVRRDLGRGALAFVGFWLMVSADIVVAQHFLSTSTASQYAVASVMGKAVLWLPTAVAVAVFPRIARDHSAGASTNRLLSQAILLTLGLSVVGVAGLAVLGRPVITAFFGHTYHPASTFAWEVGLACLPFALSNLLIYYHLAADGFRLLGAIGVAAVIEFSILAVFHGSVQQVATGLGAGGFTLCLGLFLLAMFGPATRRVVPDSAPEPAPTTG